MKVSQSVTKIALFSLGLVLVGWLAIHHSAGQASATNQLPLNDRTRAEARDLRLALHNPLNAVKNSIRQLHELSRIPDPASLHAFRAVLLGPRDYASPVRRAAATAVGQYRGMNTDATQKLLREALNQEKVREVAQELEHSLERLSPRYLARQAPAHVTILE